MLFKLLSLIFNYDLLHCVEFEKANSNGPLRIEREVVGNHNFSDSITNVTWNSTPGIYQTNRIKSWITPQSSFLPISPISHKTIIQSPTGPTPKGPSFTERFPPANRRNRKITQRKFGNRQLKNNTFRHQPRRQLHQGITVLEISKRRNYTRSRAKASSYVLRPPREPALRRIKRSHTLITGTKKSLVPNLLLGDGMAITGDDTYSDDDDELEKTIPQMDAGEGILRMQEITKTTEKLWHSDRMKVQSDQTETSTATAAYNTFTQPYFEMIETLQEGYMMVFLIELTRLVATKERDAVRDVVKHTDHIVHGFYQSGHLRWFGQPLIDVTRNIARSLKVLDIDVIQNQASNLHDMLSQRHQKLSVEVNTILEYADILYDDDEGRLLFDDLEEFAAYPNISLTGYWLCNSLIHNFLRPYRRLKGTQQRQDLIDSVNLEIMYYQKTPLRSGDVRQADGPSDETKHSPQTEPYDYTTWSPRERKRKRHHRSHKRKRERKLHQIKRYRPGKNQRYYQKHILTKQNT